MLIAVLLLFALLLQTFAIMLRGTDCSNKEATLNNGLLNGGCVERNDGIMECSYGTKARSSRCSSAKADDAFMFIGFIFCVAAIISSLILSSRSRGFSRNLVV